MMSANKFLSNLTMNYPVSGIRAMFDLESGSDRQWKERLTIKNADLVFISNV